MAVLFLKAMAIPSLLIAYHCNTERMLKKLSVLLRSSEWWNTKLPLLLGLFLFFSLSHAGQAPWVLLHLLVVLVWVCSAAAFGYFLNDSFDIEVDLLAGKPNQAVKFTVVQRILLLLLLAAAALGSLATLHNQLLFQVAAAHLFLFFAYSAPPLRLKNIPLAGMLLDSLYAWVFPITVIMLIAGVQDKNLYYITGIWAFMAGLKSILKHHLADRHADRQSDTFNIANRVGLRNTVWGVQLFFIAETAFFIYLLWLMQPVFYLLGGLLLLYLPFSFTTFTRYGLQLRVKKSWRIGNIHINPFYEDWMPVALIFYLLFQSLYFIPLVVLYLLLFRSDPLYKLVSRTYWATYKFIYRLAMFIAYRVIYNSVMFLTYRVMYPAVMFLIYKVGYNTYILFRYKLYHALRKWLLRIPPFLYYRVAVRFYHHVLLKSGWLLFSAASLVVNYTIYYFRRLVMGKTDREARKMTEEQYRQYLHEKNNPKSKTISIPVTPVLRPQKSGNDSPQPAEAPYEEPTLTTIAKETPAPPLFAPLPLTPENKIVHGLWIGEQLSALEMLTLHSFTSQGHEFHLWTYGPLKNTLPPGAVLMDANQIIPFQKVFRYKNKNKYGHGKGSVSGFSDIFRYKLLYEKGGWWVDMDVTCLKPLNLIAPYFFRQHHDLELVGNVMKVPSGDRLMKDCYEEASATIDENNTDWHKPIEILNRQVLQNQLQTYISGQISNQDKWDEVKKHVCRNNPMPENYHVIHWMNEEWRSRKLDKNDIRYNSALGKLMIKHSLLLLPDSRYQIMLNDFRHLLFEFINQD